ncbi:imidazole glycerol phosphate synthase subunit HisH [Idiomarina sp.]|uniref:imidazole glycerol phosphate synthase subunit HisH n=1 Tax=Idiomarina sp. TaxID=1874361 RepID=UPI003510E928
MSEPTSICILNYGSGNVGSVANICRTLCDEVTVSNAPEAIKSATHLILPGVGAFDRSLQKMRERLPLELIEQQVKFDKKPLMGICVGLQVLCDAGTEGGKTAGLGWLNGTVERLESHGLHLPHIGWNTVHFAEDSWFAPAFAEPKEFYFVHSFALAKSADASAHSDYGSQFVAAVERGNLFAVQFHPEKSQAAGRTLLSRFLEYRTDA